MKLAALIKKAPANPGVYIFKGKNSKILYVGKATNLRARLRSYLRLGWKEHMLEEATMLEWEELESDVASLIRESVLIKKERPKYNVMFRDDKNYFFVAITREKFPRIFLTHQPRDKTRTSKVDYVGPFTDGTSIKQVLRLLRSAFPYCTCSSNIKHKRKCVSAQIGKCLGYCCADIPATHKNIARYHSNISAIKSVLSGNVRRLQKTFEQKMRTAAKKQKYEDAKLFRDQYASLERIFKHSLYLKKDMGHDRARGLELLKDLLGLQQPPLRIEGYDISHHHGSASVASMVVFENGVPQKSDYRKFIMRRVSGINDFAMMWEVLSRRLRHEEWPLPNVFLIDGGKGQLSAAYSALENALGGEAKLEFSLRVGRVKREKIRFRGALVALAKREEELFVSGRKEPFKLRELPPPLLHLLTSIRDEAHRFAISFHRKRRQKNLLG